MFFARVFPSCMTGVFDKALLQATEWPKDVKAELEWTDDKKVLAILRAASEYGNDLTLAVHNSQN